MQGSFNLQTNIPFRQPTVHNGLGQVSNLYKYDNQIRHDLTSQEFKKSCADLTL